MSGAPPAWAGARGETWARRQAENDAFLEPLGAAALAAARVAPGESVIDVGCGCGASSLALANAVGPRGRVVGVDLSAAMLEVARARVAAAGFEARVNFLCADAATHDFDPGDADLLHSRFGVMFFDDPIAAFANLRRAMKRTGRLAFVCWQDDSRNEWKRVPCAAAMNLLPPPAPVDPEAPGAASFASVARIERVLLAAGWQNIRVAPFQCEVRFGRTIDQATEGAGELALGEPLAAATADLRERALAAVRRALEPYAGRRGVVLGAAAWIVTAVAAAP